MPADHSVIVMLRVIAKSPLVDPRTRYDASVILLDLRRGERGLADWLFPKGW